MDQKTLQALVRRADEARSRAYAPYSGFPVGAALLTASGKIYTGVNVENASYPAGICAERSALCAAVSAGEQGFTAIAVSAGEAAAPPCGICRQVLREFGDMDVVCRMEAGGDYVTRKLSLLLPESFQLTEK